VSRPVVADAVVRELTAKADEIAKAGGTRSRSPETAVCSA